MQFLESYKSVTLQSMATAFGVSVDFIDQELVDFIVAGRLPAKIDKVWLLPYLLSYLQNDALRQQCVQSCLDPAL